MNKLYILLFFLSLSTVVLAQQTVGLLTYSQANTYQGYTMIYPHNQSNVYLLDNCGEIAHVWEGEEEFKPGNVAYLQANGNVILTKRPSDISQDAIWAGGGGAIIEIKSWENEVLWSYELNNENFRLHHDIAITDEGTILAIAWEKKTMEEAMAAGRDSATMTQGELWPDYVFEIDPATDSIIWEWHSWDHLVQDHDSTSANFGVVGDSPRKINLNYDTNDGKADWLHANSLDYNPILDQVMISIPQFDEVWIIDHSTTTAQAASSQGGKSNHGGDIIYRVGNPRAYDNGTEEDQIFHYQHDAHWILDVPSSHPFYGLVAIFNNRVGEDFSTAEVFETPWMDYITDYEPFGNTWPPYDLDNTISHPVPQNMYSTGLSSVQILANGNILLCSGRQGYLFELNPDNEIVWEYITPIRAGNIVDQGTELELNNNLTFRAYKYAEDFPAFEGRDLTSKGWIETMPNEDYCAELISSTVSIEEMAISISPNPATDMLMVEWTTGMMADIKITDISGKVLVAQKGNGGLVYLDISSLNTGMYFLNVNNQLAEKILKN